MKLNWAERMAVNNPIRPIQQRIELSLLKRYVPLKPGGTILEIGCGRGAGAALIKTMFRPSRVHATDLDIDMIRKAYTYLPRNQRTGITFCVADSTWLPFGSGSMDAVFGFGVLHHVPDWQGALSEIARVLKPGGVYFFEELYPLLYQNILTRHILLHPTENRFYSKDLKQGLRKAGLELGESLEIKKLVILGVATKR